MDPYEPNRYDTEEIYREALNDLSYLHRGFSVYTWAGGGTLGV